VPCSIDLIAGGTTFLTIDRERNSGFDSSTGRLPMWASGRQGCSTKQRRRLLRSTTTLTPPKV